MIRTIGSIIREVRVSKNISLSELSKTTKIKEEFIDNIEKEKWKKLPEYPVVAGFIKRISQSLGIDEQKLVATLRRDYPPVPITVSPKKDIKTRFIWQPSYTFVVLIAVLLLIIASYLTVSYISFNAPPPLTIYTPSQNEQIKTIYYTVEGKTAPDSTVKVNNQTAFVEKDGRFHTEIELNKDTSEIVVKSISRSGKETVKTLKIRVQ